MQLTYFFFFNEPHFLHTRPANLCITMPRSQSRQLKAINILYNHIKSEKTKQSLIIREKDSNYADANPMNNQGDSYQVKYETSFS